MKLSVKIILIILLAAILVAVFFVLQKYKSKNINPVETPAPASSVIPTTLENKFAEPIAEFRDRITKKTFGTYVTPQNSPVQPERFSGYHTGVDIEYEDVVSDVPVFAIADSIVELARTASGYGGVMVLSFDLNGQKTFAVYGHLRPISFTKNKTVKKGEQIAVLGTGNSSETDNERKHLHFGIPKKSTIELRGYTSSLDELEKNWYNPLDIIK